MGLIAVKYYAAAVIRLGHHAAVEGLQGRVQRAVRQRCFAAGQLQNAVSCAEHPAFQCRSPRPGPQVKSDAPPGDGCIRGFGGVLTLQQQRRQPGCIVGLQQMQRPGADAAAPQVAAHGEVIHQPGLLPRQHHLPGVGQHGPGIIAKGQRLVQPGSQQFFHRRKGL